MLDAPDDHFSCVEWAHFSGGIAVFDPVRRSSNFMRSIIIPSPVQLILLIDQEAHEGF
jgi:hypothetical protein